jgi:hypothetical protein
VNKNTLKAEGQVGDKLYLVALDSGASLTVVRPDVTAGLPERYVRTPEALQMVSDKILPIWKGTLVKFILGWRLLTKLVFVAKITWD